MDNRGYLLDTNIISHMVRFPTGPIMSRLESILPTTACTSIVVAAEIHFGLKQKASAKLTRQAKQILSVMEILSLESPVEEHYGDIRLHLNRMGQPIGGNDLWIAAHARCLGLAVVTDNIREFSRVPGLKVENWL
jgi:tRNA(fMet)-specific endonuclease VapC